MKVLFRGIHPANNEVYEYRFCPKTLFVFPYTDDGNTVGYLCSIGVWESWNEKGIGPMSYCQPVDPCEDVFTAENAGIHLEEGPDGWYWRDHAPAPLEAIIGPFPSKELAASDFVSGADYL